MRSRSIAALLALSMLSGCGGEEPKDDTADTLDSATDTQDSATDTGVADTDADGDGYIASEDCDDEDADVNPGADEICENGKDDDCDGSVGACGLTGDFAMSEKASASLTGTSTLDHFGYYTTCVTDLSGDGLVDLLIGTHHGDLHSPHAYIFEGPISGDLTSEAAVAWFTGTLATDFEGVDVAHVADVNADGLSDVLLGAGFAYTSGEDGGEAILVHSPFVGEIDLETEGVHLHGSSGGDRLGAAIANAGDVNGDGVDDVILGAYGKTAAGVSESGAAYVISGATAESGDVTDVEGVTRLWGPTAGAHAGWSVSGAGDVNGDGLSDVVVGAPGVDEVYLVTSFGSSYGLSSGAAVVAGSTPGDQLGYAVVGGDFTADGYSDIAIGAPSEASQSEGAGAVYVFFGDLSGDLVASDADWTLLGEEPGDQAGYSIANGRDTDGDGRVELLVGATSADGEAPGAGAAYLLREVGSGVVSLSGASMRLGAPASAGDGAAEVTGLGDVDGDGLGDLLLTAFRASWGSANQSGTTYLVLGEGW